MRDEAALFKALADPTRLRLAVLLAIRGETCVCVLAEALDQPDFKISRHLGVMRSAGLVEARREGTWMHYRLVKARSALERHLQDCFRDCLARHPDVRKDLARLKKVACRIEGGKCD
ncbi:metalloregulator ArsR/SmtB family transcription factor [Candidatus Sumerlaeota bacterium]|nr:metalloregulator ArsR/SmtB family transcription factor [Candidatus Sumerlaeota bacterium]